MVSGANFAAFSSRNAYGVALDAAKEFRLELPKDRDALTKDETVNQVKEALQRLKGSASFSATKLPRVESYLLGIERASVKRARNDELDEGEPLHKKARIAKASSSDKTHQGWVPALTGVIASYATAVDAQAAVKGVSDLFQRPIDGADLLQAYRGREEVMAAECIEKWLENPSAQLEILHFPGVKNLNDFLRPIFGKASVDQITTIIAALAKSCPNLEVVDLQTCREIAPEAITHLAALKNLKRLEVHKSIKKEHLPALCGLTGLEELALCCVDQLDDSSLETLSKMNGLKKLELIYCKKFTNHGFSYIKHMQNLRSLVVHFELFPPQITNAALEHILQMTWLEDLRLNHCGVFTEEGYRGLAGMSKLKNLYAGSVRITQYVMGMPELKSLRCGGDVRDEDLRHLSECVGLEELDLHGARITDVGLQYLAKLVNITKLKLPGNITDAGLAHISHMTQMESFECDHNPAITDEGLQHFALMKGLKRVSLMGCNNLTGVGFRYFEPMVNMEELNLWWCSNLQDTAFSHMKKMEKMKRLKLYENPLLTSALFQHLSAMKDMEEFHAPKSGFSLTDLPSLFHMTKLKQLLARSSAATIDGIEHLKMFGQLVDLDIGFQAGDKDTGLTHLMELSGLRRLFFGIGDWNCKEDETASRALQQAIPRLRFEWFY